MRTFFFIYLILLITDFLLLVLLGTYIGAGGAFALILGSLAIGSWALFTGARSRSIKVQQGTRIEDPTRLLLEWVIDLVAGLALIFPGPVSDVVGLLLLLPPVRYLVLPRIRKKMEAGRWSFFSQNGGFRGGFTMGGMPPFEGMGSNSPFQSQEEDPNPEQIHTSSHSPSEEEEDDSDDDDEGIRDVNFEILPEDKGR